MLTQQLAIRREAFLAQRLDEISEASRLASGAERAAVPIQREVNLLTGELQDLEQQLSELETNSSLWPEIRVEYWK